MTTLDQALDQLQAVTDKLAGPLRVWVLVNECSSERFLYVFASEQAARKAWIELVVSDCSERGIDFAEKVQAIEQGATWLWVDNDEEESYDLSQEEVQS